MDIGTCSTAARGSSKALLAGVAAAGLVAAGLITGGPAAAAVGTGAAPARSGALPVAQMQQILRANGMVSGGLLKVEISDPGPRHGVPS